MLKLINITKNIRHLKYSSNPYHRLFHEEFTKPPPKPSSTQIEKQSAAAGAPQAFSSKFQVFKDEDAPIIFDIDEERQKLNAQKIIEKEIDVYEGLNLKRGLTGVFDIEDLVEALRKENAENIFVCAVPKELKYVDYICIVSGFSHRHRKAMAQFIRKLVKLKRNSNDILPKIEGENSTEWMAMDLGNIALHIFDSTARKRYKLEPLWTVGSQYDDETNKPVDKLLELYEKHTIFLSDLKPKT